MDRLDKLNLTNWQKEDIIDLLDEYPNFFDMDSNTLNEISKKLYREAQSFIDKAMSIECKADTIKIYLKALGE